MIKSFFFALFILFLLPLSAQQIIEFEYFFNDDPGFGNGQNLIFTQGEEISIFNEIDVSSLETGCHVLKFRCKNENGNWSFTQTKNFYRLPDSEEIPDITKLQYSFSSDFPAGNTFEHSFVSDLEIDENFIIDLDTLANGFHTLFIRLINENSSVSFTQSKSIFKSGNPSEISEITEVKYFFQLDESDAVFLYPENNISIEEQIEVSLANLDYGFHRMYFQVKNQTGAWSMRYSKPILKKTTEIVWDLAGIEWYFTGQDADADNTFFYEFAEHTTTFEDAFDISLLHLTQGNQYVLHLAALDENNTKSMEQQFPFQLNFIPQNVIITETNDSVLLEWNEIIGATNYKVFSSDLPYFGFQLDENGTFNGASWQTSISQQKKFYHVVAEIEERNKLTLPFQ